MLKWTVTFLFVILLTHCGKPAPVITGIDLPPVDTGPSSVSNPNNGDEGSVAQNSPSESNQEVKILNAPLVLLRGEIEQYQTTMNAAPGA